jgi:type I restriction enzyme M protein
MQDSLWQAATALRDRLAPHETRDLVLTLLAVRQLGTRPGAPDACAWSRLQHDPLPALEAATRALVAWQPHLADALPDLPQVEAHRVRDVIDAITALPARSDHDVLGEAYMHLLGHFARSEGRRGGQYYTPTAVAQLLTAVVGPIQGTVYDPCCGSAGLLLQAGQHATGPVRLVGQELNPRTRALALLGAAMHGVELEAGPVAADTLHRDLHPDLRAQHIVANPPFNLARWGAERATDDPRFHLGRAPDANANLAWLQHIVAHLAPQGRGAVILANGSLSSRSGGEDALRAALVDAGHVEGIIALPDLLFLTTPIPACIWLLGPGGNGSVLFVDARALGRKVDRALRVIDDADVQHILRAVQAHRRGEPVDQVGFARAVGRQDLVAEDLTPGRYVSPPPSASTSLDLAALARDARAQLRDARTLDAALEPLLATLEDPTWRR